MTYAEQKHRSEVLAEIKGMPGRQSILRRLDEETNATVRIWIWEYLQSLDQEIINRHYRDPGWYPGGNDRHYRFDYDAREWVEVN